MQKAGVTGLSIAIVNDSQVVYTRQFGWKDKDAATKLDDATVFGAGSLSKPVFAYVVATLAEEGAIDLDKPLQQYLARPLSEYPNYRDLASDPRYRAITARMVLSHTSGLPNSRAETRDGRLRIEQEPGSRFLYSGEAIDLLQLAIEELTHTDLNTLAQNRVFRPFGMSRTSYVWSCAIASNVAAHHNEFEWASEPDRPPTADAAGSMMTTAHDFARFLVGVLAAQGQRAVTIDKMLTPTIRITSRGMFDSRDRTDAGDSKRLAWGLGWGLFDSPYGRAFFHTGHKGGVQNYAVVYRDRGIGIVLLSNSDNFESVAREIVAAGIGDTASPFDWLGYPTFDPALRKPPPRRLVAIQLTPEVIAPYQGDYEWSGGVLHVKADGNQLFASDDGSSWDELSASSESVFFFKGRTLTLTFVKDANGSVTRIDVDNDGMKMSAQRRER